MRSSPARPRPTIRHISKTPSSRRPPARCFPTTGTASSPPSGAGRRTEMNAADAVADALRDVRLHELATVVAMQSAVRALMEELDPAKLRRAAERGGLDFVPMQRKANAWEAFEALHARITHAL